MAGSLMSFMVSTQMAQRSLGSMSMLLGYVVRGASAGGRVWYYINMEPQIPIEVMLCVDSPHRSHLV